MENGRNVLIGITEIIEYMKVSRPTFYQFIEMGMPAQIINNRWYAHKANIDLFFQKITNKRITDIPKNAE